MHYNPIIMGKIIAITHNPSICIIKHYIGHISKFTVFFIWLTAAKNWLVD